MKDVTNKYYIEKIYLRYRKNNQKFHILHLNQIKM